MRIKHNPFWYVNFVIKAFATPVVATLVGLFPRDKKKVAMGAWMGRQFCDNPKYLLLYLLKHSDYQITWIAHNEVAPLLPHHTRLHFARKGSLMATWALLRAGIWISCQNKEADLTVKPIYTGALRLNLWHGIPIKGMGELAPAEQEMRTKRKRPLYRLFFTLLRSKPDWTVISNKRMGEIMAKSFPNFFSEKMMLSCGYPRNDYLINNKNNHRLISELRRKYAHLLGFDDNQKIILYLPTYRINKTEIFSFYSLSGEGQRQWRDMLSKNKAVIIEKHHPVTYARMPPPVKSILSKVVMPEMQVLVDTQEILLISDLLICDYTSAYIDYSLLGRPCIHYAADIDAYSKDSGLVYKYEDVVSGRIVKTPARLLQEVERQLVAPVRSCGRLLSELVEYEHGTACEQILQFVQKEGER